MIKPRANPARLPKTRRPPEPFRWVDIFAFDPTRGKRLGNHLTIRIPHEPLGNGPIGRQIAVIDYDTSNDHYYEPIDLDLQCRLRPTGLRPNESDPRFHQQMVYGVTMQTIDRFELALGRDVTWPWRRERATNSHQLRILPHAMHEANAFYDRSLRGLFFGYFTASEDTPGANLPGQVVFTCLSHDVVVHEMTHALLDCVRPYFLEPSSPDTAAFHEALGDVIAILQHFSHREALIETIRRTEGRIYRDLLSPEISPLSEDARIGAETEVANPLVDLARQFGEALGVRAALRSALGTKRRLQAHDEPFEPHERGSLLVAAMFDTYFSVYIRRTRDLMRLARAGDTLTEAGDLHPDLANRLAAEATKTARHLEAICIKGLDYCPPVGVTFGDYLRAMVTADTDLTPKDPWGYRAALIDAFRERGIYPSGTRSLSEQSLLWPGEDLHCPGLVPGDAAANVRVIREFGQQQAEALGLDPERPIFVRRAGVAFSERLDPSGQRRTQFVAQLTQRRTEPIFPEDHDSETFRFRGGTAVVLDPDGGVERVVSKPLDDPARLESQRAYLWRRTIDMPTAAFSSYRLPTAGVAAIHRGY